MTKNQYTEEQMAFINAIVDIYPKLYTALLAWENLTEEDNGLTSEKNPFGMSFDEWMAEYLCWVGHMRKVFSSRFISYSPTLTVGDLKKIIESINDDTQIVVADQKEDWWLNIAQVEIPDEEDGMFTLTFHTKNTFDTRQF